MGSIQNRLFVYLSVTLIVLIGFAAGRLYYDAHQEVDDLFDSQLAEAATVLLAQAGDELHHLDDGDEEDEWLESIEDMHPHDSGLIFQLRDSAGQLLFRSSRHLPTEALSTVSEGFADEVIHGRRVRVFSLWDPSGKLQIQVGQPETRRIAVSARVTRDLILPLLLILPVSLLAVWLAVRSSMGRLKTVTAQVQGMSPGSLQKLDGPVPTEIEPLVAATNGLITRLDEALASERQFTADAAHELRTPLAGIRAQAEAALGANEQESRDNALRMLLQGVDRAAGSVDQLLTLARLDPNAVFPVQRVDLHAVAHNVLAHTAAVALGQQIDLELTGTSAAIAGEPELVRLLVRNLVDNAIRFSPADSIVRVDVHQAAGESVLRVTDEGPGIPVEYRNRIFDRFYRVPHASQEGSGLGLAIVKQIADRHGAHVEVNDNTEGRGTCITVRFPASVEQET